MLKARLKVLARGDLATHWLWGKVCEWNAPCSEGVKTEAFETFETLSFDLRRLSISHRATSGNFRLVERSWQNVSLEENEGV